MKKKAIEYNAYIDESGDEGINRGSNYFILTAIIVKKENDLDIARKVDSIKENLELNRISQLHWNRVKGRPNKQMIVDSIKDLDIILINVIIDTRKIKFIPSKDMYYYFTEYLYERISKMMIEMNGCASLYISSRSQLNKEDLIGYIKRRSKKHSIDYSRINLTKEQIKIHPNKQKRILQLADCCCSALGHAIKYNNKQCCDIYKPLLSKCYSRYNHINNYGIKFVPPEGMPNDFLLLEEIKKSSKETV